MRREEILEAIEEIRQVLAGGQLSTVTRWGDNDTPDTGSDNQAMDLWYQFRRAYEAISPPAKSIATEIDLAALLNPRWWTDAAESAAVTRRAMREAARSVQRLQFLQELIQQENAPPEGQAEFTLLLPEVYQSGSTVDRVVNALEGAQIIYQVCTALTQSPPSELVVIACDSGSDKSFDFLGFAKVMEATKEIILGLWDKVFLGREQKLAFQLETFSKTLPAFVQIADMEQQQQIDHETASRLRMQLSDGLGKLIKADAILADHPTPPATTIDIRALASPPPQQLGSGQSTGVEANEGQ